MFLTTYILLIMFLVFVNGQNLCYVDNYCLLTVVCVLTVALRCLLFKCSTLCRVYLFRENSAISSVEPYSFRMSIVITCGENS